MTTLWILALCAAVHAEMRDFETLSLLVPDGWTAEQQGTTIVMKAASSDVSLSLASGKLGEASLEDVARRLYEQLGGVDFEEDEEGDFYFEYRDTAGVQSGVWVYAGDEEEYLVLASSGGDKPGGEQIETIVSSIQYHVQDMADDESTEDDAEDDSKGDDDTASDDVDVSGRRVMGYSQPPIDISYLAKNPPKNITKRALSANIPAKYDLRNTGRLTPVKDQGDYGTCWAHAAMAACESNYLTRSQKGNFSGSLGNARTLNLSEMHLAWFAYHNPDRTKAFPPHDENTARVVYNMGNKGILNQGGNEWRSAAILSRLGLVAESSMPYGKFPSGSAKPGGYPRVLRVKEATIAVLEEGSAEQRRIVKQLIMDKGAVLISYDEDSAYHDNRRHSYFKKGSKTTNHMITVVGWDDNYSRKNFGRDKPSRDGAWLCRNSWGPRWGAGGYFWMSYEQYHRSGTAFTVEPLKEKMRHYGHENMGWVESIFLGGRRKSGFEAAVFQALESGESVSEAGFYTTDNGTRYTVSVYVYGANRPAASSLTAGVKPAAEKSGTFDLAGYHTVKLPQNVPVRKGEWFSVVVRLTNPSHDFPFAVEQRVEGYTDNVVVNAGNCYFSANGKSWTDGAKLPELSKNFRPSNATVKAFTLCGREEPKPEPDEDEDEDEDSEDEEWDEEDYEDFDDDYDDEYDEDWDDEDYEDEEWEEEEEEEDDEEDDEDEEWGEEEEDDDDSGDEPKPTPKPATNPVLPDNIDTEEYDVGIILIPKRK
ncbi:MAG: hypothetical protein IJU98_07480 [Synergistaceae bacterium]|nr:hypothetical protein [Synergistaceae bacterium]